MACTYFRCLNHTESWQRRLEVIPEDHSAPPAMRDVRSQHSCHVGYSNIPSSDMTFKKTALANIKQSHTKEINQFYIPLLLFLPPCLKTK